MESSSDLLVCPTSGVPVHLMSLDEAGRRLGGRALAAPEPPDRHPVGLTSEVLLRDDLGGAYPVVDGVPVLMAPEMLATGSGATTVDVTAPTYAEAYEEMEHYSSVAAQEAMDVASSAAARSVDPLLAMPADARSTFPLPGSAWLDATYELKAQHEAFEHLGSLVGSRVLQVGGRGLQAVKFLLAGADEAWVVTPMVGELLFARALAEYAGVADRLRLAAAVAEELPLAAGSMDAVYAQGSVHHWMTRTALPECARVLRPGGRFAAVEPWRAPLYGIGTRVLGKRDPAVRCVVLTADRVVPHLSSFADPRILHHGTLSRYPLIALGKFGIKASRRALWRIATLDDALCSVLRPMRGWGSSVAILATVHQ